MPISTGTATRPHSRSVFDSCRRGAHAGISLRGRLAKCSQQAKHTPRGGFFGVIAPNIETKRTLTKQSASFCVFSLYFRRVSVLGEAKPQSPRTAACTSIIGRVRLISLRGSPPARKAQPKLCLSELPVNRDQPSSGIAPLRPRYSAAQVS